MVRKDRRFGLVWFGLEIWFSGSLGVGLASEVSGAVSGPLLSSPVLSFPFWPCFSLFVCSPLFLSLARLA